MKITAWLLPCFILFSLNGLGEDNTTRILFGSCLKQANPAPIFDSITSQPCDAFIFLGDNIYADTEDMMVMKAQYAKLAAIPGFVKLKKSCPLFATWDDHDYGVNDGGAGYPKRIEAQSVFQEFWGYEKTHPGVYQSFEIGSEEKRIQILMLDTRYFRGPLKKGERRVGGPYYPEENPNITMLGEGQWKWLESELKKPAAIRIIATSIQFIAEAAGQETWSNLPNERQRLIDLITNTKANGVFFISGDRHWADFSAQTEGVPYPLHDFTSSGLNQIHKRGTPTLNQFRIGKTTWHQENFGELLIAWKDPNLTKIECNILDLGGNVQLSHSIKLRDLKAH